MTREPVNPTPRKKLSVKERLEVLVSGGGKCCFCREKITGAFDVSHRVPLALGGLDEPDNREPAHPDCHKAHTRGVDIPNIARAKRRNAKQIARKGEERPKKRHWPSQQLHSRPFPSTHTRGFDGKVRPKKAKREPMTAIIKGLRMGVGRG